MPYPKTGRDWRYSMPTAANVVEKIADALSPSKRGPAMTIMLLFIIFMIISNVPFDATLQCVTTVKASCYDQNTCFTCKCCADTFFSNNPSDEVKCLVHFVFKRDATGRVSAFGGSFS